MTYCIAASIDEGLVLVSDSRTNAGIDNVSSYSKMHVFDTPADRKLILLSAGNLATTQAVLEQLHRDKVKEAEVNLNNVECLSAAANYLGQVSVEKQKQHKEAAGQNAFDPSASFILAGQINHETHGAFMIYPQGNSITTSANTPFLQIGEIKYGKPVLDRFLKPETSLNEAARCCLVSMDSTVRSNASVGPPIELLIYRKDSFKLDEYYCFQDDDAYMLGLRRQWEDQLREAFAKLPMLDKKYVKPLIAKL
ncbi:peptidase [Methylomarinum vadi]|uniref:peptidase n=1 Tax=Methylomarinum vadi TaxID=438855 RepID=UPI0004DF2222|nr:peptidase [Methylomarinum vadi]